MHHLLLPPRVLRKVIPASRDENRGQALLVNTKLTLLTSFSGDSPKHHAWRWKVWNLIWATQRSLSGVTTEEHMP